MAVALPWLVPRLGDRAKEATAKGAPYLLEQHPLAQVSSDLLLAASRPHITPLLDT